MTAQQTPDRDQPRKLADGHEPDEHGPDKCGKSDCYTSCAECGDDWPCLTVRVTDQLDRAEADVKRGRAEALRDAASADWGNSDTLWRRQKVRMKLISLAHQIEEETPDEQ